MLQALKRLLRRADPAQLALDFGAAPPPPPAGRGAAPPAIPAPSATPAGPAIVGAPRTADELLERLRGLGLASIHRCRLTRNRNVVVSFARGELRIHEAFRTAPESVLRAVVAFVDGRTRGARAAARKVIVAFELPPGTRRPPRHERTHRDDEPAARRLAAAHAEYNARHFGGTLAEVPIRVSRRMKSRLGHYTPAGADHGAEIAISRSHIRRHGWDEALHTLLHEMVHQWQAETGRPVDHGREFRRKCREVGITPFARRTVGRVDEPSVVVERVSAAAADRGRRTG